MPDLETRLPELLRDLATDVAAGGRPAPVLRRARRRRALTVATTAVTAAALIAGAVFGVRELTPANRSSIGGSSSPSVSTAPAPSAIGAVWPETTAEGLAFAQQQADDGHQPWRTDPAMTAEAFAVDVLGWAPEDVASNVRAVPGTADILVVSVTNVADAPVTKVTLQQLGEHGHDGVWSVIRADTSLLTTTVEDGADGSRGVRVQIDGGAPVQISHEVYDGSTLDSPVTGGVVSDASSIPLPAESPTGAVVVVISAIAGGNVVGADVFQVPTAVSAGAGPSTTATPQPTAVPPEGLPATVAATRDAILQAIDRGDIDALKDLIDPNTFAYNFDDGSNPIPAWKAHPAVLDPIPTLLRMPPAEPKHIEGYGTFYIWPYLVDADMNDLTQAEIEDMHALGLDDAEIEVMRKQGSYLGPRLSIDENGLWRNYTLGGD